MPCSDDHGAMRPNEETLYCHGDKHDGDYVIEPHIEPHRGTSPLHARQKRAARELSIVGHAVVACKSCRRTASCSIDGEPLCAACEQPYTSLRLALLTEDFDNMKMGTSCPLSPLHQMALSNSLSNSLAASCYASPRTSRETSPTALRATGS